MILYRIVDKQFSSNRDILSGLGASINGGRWNSPQIRVIYCGSDLKTSVAEKAFYVLTPRIELFFNRNIKRSKNKKFWKDLIDIPYVLVTLNLNFVHGKKDICVQAELSSTLKQAYLPPHYTVSDYRKSPYESLPGMWTQVLGDHCANQNYKSVSALSARSNTGTAVAVFSGALRPSEVEIVAKEEITLSAVNRNGAKIKIGNRPIIDKVHFKSSEHEFVTDIIDLPV